MGLTFLVVPLRLVNDAPPTPPQAAGAACCCSHHLFLPFERHSWENLTVHGVGLASGTKGRHLEDLALALLQVPPPPFSVYHF